MSKLDSSIGARPSTCPRCGNAFGCGVDTSACWCTRLPPDDPAMLSALLASERSTSGVPAVAPAADCLCPDCLALLTAQLNKDKGDP